MRNLGRVTTALMNIDMDIFGRKRYFSVFFLISDDKVVDGFITRLFKEYNRSVVIDIPNKIKEG